MASTLSGMSQLKSRSLTRAGREAQRSEKQTDAQMENVRLRNGIGLTSVTRFYQLQLRTEPLRRWAPRHRSITGGSARLSATNTMPRALSSPHQ